MNDKCHRGPHGARFQGSKVLHPSRDSRWARAVHGCNICTPHMCTTARLPHYCTSGAHGLHQPDTAWVQVVYTHVITLANVRISQHRAARPTALQSRITTAKTRSRRNRRTCGSASSTHLTSAHPPDLHAVPCRVLYKLRQCREPRVTDVSRPHAPPHSALCMVDASTASSHCGKTR